MPDQPVLVTPADVAASVGADASDADVVAATEAAVAYVLRYLTPPPAGQSWGADRRLGAKRLAIGLYRDKLTPGVIESLGGDMRAAHRRATDIEIEQLLRIGRHAVPVVG